MNIIWTSTMIISFIILIFVEPKLILETMLLESKNVVSLCINLIAIYAVWLGILEILEKTGISEHLANLLSPFIKKVFKIEDKKQIKYISLNLSANMLGLGNAATPSGINAINCMKNDLKRTKFAIFMLIIVNSTSIQLFPTTIIGMLINNNASNPSNIIIPTLISTGISTLLGIVLLNVYYKLKKEKL